MQPLVLSPRSMAANVTRGAPGCTAAVGLRQAMLQGTRKMRQGCLATVGCRSRKPVPLPSCTRPQAARRVWSGLVRGSPQHCTPPHRHRRERFGNSHTRTHTDSHTHTRALTHTSTDSHTDALTRDSWPGARRERRAGAMQVAHASKSGRGAALGSGGRGSGEEGETGGATQRLVWGLYGAYMLWLLVLPYAPGEPAWDIQPETVEEVRDLSLNFFFVLPLLSQAGIHTMETPSLHPAAEALFNFVNAWSFMFGPLLQLDSRQRPQSSPPARAAAIWSGQAFLTNVFLIPYMALRLQAPKDSTGTDNTNSTVSSGSGGFMEWLGSSLLGAARPLGAVGGAVAALSLFWFCYGRVGEGYGDGVPARWAYFVEYISTNRLAYAFVVDIVLYSVFQAWLVSAVLRRKEAEGGSSVPRAVKAFGYVPCFGLAALLVAL